LGKKTSVILRTRPMTSPFFEPGQLEEDYQITTVSENKIMSSCFLIHKFEGCFLRGQVSSNGFKVFNGCIVEP